jgi:4-aminobutyrate aminotransferase
VFLRPVDRAFKGGTYAGNAVSCAAAVAVANAFREEKVLDNVSVR